MQCLRIEYHQQHTQTMFWLLLILCIKDGSSQIGIVENPLAYYDGSNNTSAIFESKFQRGKGNRFNFNIHEDVVSHSQNCLWFDWNASDAVVFEIIDDFVLDVKTLNNDTALVQLKLEAVFNDNVVLECLKKFPSEDVFDKVLDWGLDHYQVFSPTHQKRISMVSDETYLNNNLIYNTNENSVCRGDSGGELLMVSGWGVANTTKMKKCHWPAFWLVVCPWYGIQHCQSK